ncbi:MAG: M48 family metalloprotease [Acidobacteria bacterium]|nr:M48 family metalloprotease [Acidobacteriota bacterium]
MRSSLVVVAVATVVLLGCATNPATGRRQLDLIGEGLEIDIGRAADPGITASMGVIEDATIREYISDLGLRLAATSERPELPWSFTVLDDPLVNAFALPGGFVYVTRGILAHFASEAELAGVLGHEIGHVTARHGVSRISRIILQQVTLEVAKEAWRGVRQYGELLDASLGLVNLDYSRDEETQSDELGVRYMTRDGYDPRALEGVFRMLASVSGTDGSRLPEWQLTHPYPENREMHIRDVIASLPAEQTAPNVERDRDTYLERLEGLTYGLNPRDGYFRDDVFLHPTLGFQFTVPADWTGENRRTTFVAIGPGDDGLVTVQAMEEVTDATQAMKDFLGQPGVVGGSVRQVEQHGLQGVRAPFVALESGEQSRGEVLCLEHERRIFRVVGVSTSGGWLARRRAVLATLESLAPLTDPAVLAAEPWRLEIVTVPESMTLQTFHERFDSPASAEETARINRVALDELLPAGARLKRVVGRPVP